MEQSVDFASMIQNELKNSSKRSDRGVRQAGFLVLRESSMPSVLVELGFISNPTEEAYMTSPVGQQSLANSLFNAFAQYKADHDRKTGKNYYAAMQPETAKTTPATTPPPGSAKTEPKQTTIQSPKTSVAKTETKPAQEVLPPPKASAPSRPPVAAVKRGEVVYKVQILVSSTPLPPNSPRLKGYKTSSYVEDGLYKYTYGSTTDIDEINQIKAAVKKDFPDAFTVRFVDEKRIK